MYSNGKLSDRGTNYQNKRVPEEIGDRRQKKTYFKTK